MSATGIGASVKRREDDRFLTGQGQYLDDMNLPGQAHAVFVRSPYAHAAIRGLDLDEARAAPGVIAIFTGADWERDDLGSIPTAWCVTSKDGTAMKEPRHAALVADVVRHVGDLVAVVIADTQDNAAAAAALVDVDYDERPAIVDTGHALDEDAPQVWPEAPGNVCFDWELGDRAAVTEAMAKAAHVVTLDLVNQRLVANAMEPRAAIADYHPRTGEYTLYTTTQNPHVTRLLMGAFVLKVPEHKLRVVAPDVGGGFGSKIAHYAEEAALTWAAGKLGRPIKWTSTRSEAFMSDTQGRDHVTRVTLALDESGRFLALEEETVANLGAYLSTLAPSIPTYLHSTLLAGCYTTPAIYANVKAVFTHTVAVEAYRGAGRPETTYMIERIVDVAAARLGLDRVAIRRQNFIQPDQFPYQTPVALVYDIGDYDKTLDMALEKADWDGFPGRRSEAAARGKLRGIGLSTYVEACGIAPSAVIGALGARAGLYETAQVRVHPTGSVTVYTGSHSHGQGHETTFAQLASDYLGIPYENVDIVHGDTGKIGFGMGTYGSRSLAVGGSAIIKALDKVIDKARKIAAHLMEAGADDVEFQDGHFQVVGTDKKKSFAEVALAAYVPHDFPHDTLEPGLDETAFYDPKNFTYPYGSHIVELEIDPETGAVELCNVVVADDVGTVINPMIVDGQFHGGLAQGIGQALHEQCVYDGDSGQLLTGSYMNYTMPRAADLPFFEVGNHATACTHNPVGAKGCGEIGSIGVPPAVINAIVDALSGYGVEHIDMPATPERIWRTIRDAEKRRES